jgi:acid ceramidase
MEDSYPPDDDDAYVPRLNIDLDLPMSDRWTEFVTEQKDNIVAMIDEFLDRLEVGPWGKIENFLALIDENADMILGKMQYGEEIRGISVTTGIDLAELIVFNLGYELMGVCTSIVAQDETGHMYHGRNLDFGLFLGKNFTDGPDSDFQWKLTELLRPLVAIVDYSRNGSTVYSGVVYAGYVGLLTGVRQNSETVTVDSRFDDNYDKYLTEWLTNPDDDAQLLTHMLREAIEDDTISSTFQGYVDHVAGTDLVGPSYAIIGGPSAGDGAVVTLGPNMTEAIDIWMINEALPASAESADKFYVLETNYDHWDEPPIVDDRRTPAEDCMDNYVTASGVSKAAIYNVLHASPNRNRLTTYTALMDCVDGTIEASLQYCWEKSCVLW